MIRRLVLASPVLALAVGAAGCGASGRVKEETIEVKPNTALNEARQLLENYARGQPLGSEAAGFDAIVAEVRKTDAGSADVLQKGFADLQKSKTGTASKAKDILRQLQPKAGVD